jgi:hypothetical protein
MGFIAVCADKCAVATQIAKMPARSITLHFAITRVSHVILSRTIILNLSCHRPLARLSTRLCLAQSLLVDLIGPATVFLVSDLVVGLRLRTRNQTKLFPSPELSAEGPLDFSPCDQSEATYVNEVQPARPAMLGFQGVLSALRRLDR